MRSLPGAHLSGRHWRPFSIEAHPHLFIHRPPMNQNPCVYYRSALLSCARMEGGVPPEVLANQDITAEGACLVGSMRLPPAEPPNNCLFCSPSYVSPHRYFFPQYFMQMLYSLLQASRV